MTDLVKRWIALQVDLGSFDRRDTIYVFAVKMSFLTIILSMLLSILVMPLIRLSGFLPTTLTIAEAVSLAVAVSWLVGGAVSGMLALVTGHAIYDLSLSRAEFQHLSRTDMLSGLLNRRAFSDILQETHENASLVVFDVDRFKTINDCHGHAVGDRVIENVAATLLAAFDDRAIVARLGGEEFGVIVHGEELADRMCVVRKARDLIAQMEVVVEDNTSIRLTISGGVADIWPQRRKDLIYSTADKALYLAKAAGRNRVVHESEGLGQSGYGQGDDPSLSGMAEMDGLRLRSGG